MSLVATSMHGHRIEIMVSRDEMLSELKGITDEIMDIFEL
jgi:hypothetical protein